MPGRFCTLLALSLGISLFLPAAARADHRSGHPEDHMFRITNPLALARPDARIDIPVPEQVGRAAPGWGVYVRGKWITGQYLPRMMVVRFVTSLAAKETLTVRLAPIVLPKQPSRVQVVLNVQDGGQLKNGVVQGGVFHLRSRYQVPKSHFIHDGLIAFEGIGWESDKVAYRLYLDSRNVTDLFGKYGPGMIFQKVGQGFDDYQYPRDWGGDIFKVGNSLGVGGIGLLRNGRVTQTGPSHISGFVVANGPVTAIAGVNADAVGGGAGFLHARYTISAGSALTYVSVLAARLNLPLITGLTVHPQDNVQLDPMGTTGKGWRYIGVWGAQEHGPDPVGTAVFYKAEDVNGTPQFEPGTIYVRFVNPNQVRYAFAGRWSQEGRKAPGGGNPVKNEAAFRRWLENTRDGLNAPVEVQLVEDSSAGD